jgi:hypothetical protein
MTTPTVSGIVLFVCSCVGTDATTTSTPPKEDDALIDGATGDPDAGATIDGGAGADASDGSGLSVMTLRNPSAPGHPAIGAAVTISNVVVTGLKTSGTGSHGFFVQDRAATSWAGVFVYTNTSPVTVAKGDVVTVSGTYTSHRGFEEIATKGKTPVKTGTAAVPAPLLVPAFDIADGGSRVKELQSMLLRVATVEVSRSTVGVDFAVRPQGVTSGPELVITSYIVNDLGPSPFTNSVGTAYSSITGFGYQFGPTDVTSVAKLAPDSVDDVAQ